MSPKNGEKEGRKGAQKRLIHITEGTLLLLQVGSQMTRGCGGGHKWPALGPQGPWAHAALKLLDAAAV